MRTIRSKKEFGILLLALIMAGIWWMKLSMKWIRKNKIKVARIMHNMLNW